MLIIIKNIYIVLIDEHYIRGKYICWGCFMAISLFEYNETAYNSAILIIKEIWQKRRLDGIGFVVDVRKSKCKL